MRPTVTEIWLMILTLVSLPFAALEAEAHEGVLHACASANKGKLRLVADPTECRPNEQAVSWNIAG